jgi:hypothetical protein
MASFLNQRLTNVGWDALSTALGGGRLTFYKLQAGDGTIANDDAILAMTGLKQPVCDIGITKYQIEGDGQITLFGNIVSDQLDAGFTFRELGVFATIEPPVGGKGGTPSGSAFQVAVAPPSVDLRSNPVVPAPTPGTALMYSYANAYAYSDYIPGKTDSTGVVNTIQVTVKIAEAENVQVTITAGQTLEVANIGAPSVGAGPWSYTAANIAWLKRLKEGPLIDITEDANTITIGQRVLTSDLDLYVANGNPDISPNFSSIQKALDYLGQYLIPVPIQARIHVSRGFYYSDNLIWCNHPNGQAITIQGPQNATQNATGFSITGSANNWSVTCTGIANTSQFVVGDWAMLYGMGLNHANNGIVAGFYRVTAKTASSVTVQNRLWKTSFATTSTGLEITPISVLLLRNQINESVIQFGAYGVGTFQYIGMIPNVAPDGSRPMSAVNITGDGYFNYVGIAGFQGTLSSTSQNVIRALAANGNLYLKHCAATYNMCGFVVSVGSIALDGCSVTDCWFRGLWCETGSFSVIYSATYCCGNNQGVVISSNGNIGIVATYPNPGVLYIYRNDGWGIWVTHGGGMNFTSSICWVYVFQNNLSTTPQYDVVASNFGKVSSSAQISGSRIFNLPVGTVGANGGLIN